MPEEREQIGQNWFQKTMRTIFGVAIIYREGRELKTHYIDVISSVRIHNSAFIFNLMLFSYHRFSRMMDFLWEKHWRPLSARISLSSKLSPRCIFGWTMRSISNATKPSLITHVWASSIGFRFRGTSLAVEIENVLSYRIDSDWFFSRIPRQIVGRCTFQLDQ